MTPCRLMPGCLSLPKWGHTQDGHAASPKPSPVLPLLAACLGRPHGAGVDGTVCFRFQPSGLSFPHYGSRLGPAPREMFCPSCPHSPRLFLHCHGTTESCPSPPLLLCKCPKTTKPQWLPPLCSPSCENPACIVPFTSALALATPSATMLQKKQEKRGGSRSQAVGL